MSERPCSSPAVTARVCTDALQGGRVVYCFRPCGGPGITDGLDLFPSLSPSPQVQSVRSYTDRFRPKTGYFLLNITTTADVRLISATQALVFSRE